MNFPLELPIFQFFYWLVNTPGVGAAVVGLLVAGAVTAFALTLRWIVSAKNTEQEAHPYPPQH
ncbi:MAG: hypothetical protein PHQ36_12640 [Anaerolineales bacterium]|nr:hypothetical protein [Anaerolineales bacterium]